MPMISTDVLVAGVIAALLVLGARLYVILTALGVVMVWVAFATARQVMMATTVARSMAPHREDFWVRIIRVFILWFGFFLDCSLRPCLFARVLTR